MLDLMLDIETLGTSPGCVVTQVCIVPFNINGKEYDGVNKPLEVNINIGDSIYRGLKIDPETLEWWTQQDPEIQSQVLCGVTSVTDAVKIVDKYISNVVITEKEYRIWSTSAKLDFGCMSFLSHMINKRDLFYYRSERCARTLTDFAKLLIPSLKLPKGTNTHYAIDDCKRQIADLQAVYKALREAVNNPKTAEQVEATLIYKPDPEN